MNLIKNPLKKAEEYRVSAEQMWTKDIYDQHEELRRTKVRERMAEAVAEKVFWRIALTEDRQSFPDLVKVETEVYVLTKSELKELLEK